MDIKDGIIKIYIDDIIKNDLFLVEFAKHAAFNRTLFDGITQLIIKDEVQWDPEDKDIPWSVSVSFGRSYFEKARLCILERLDEISKTQINLYKNERNTYEKYYNEYLTKCAKLENEISRLKEDLYQAKHHE